MDKNGKLLLGLLFTWFSLVIALFVLNGVEKIQPYRLTLTGEGCAFAQSLDLPVEKKDGVCSTIASYTPFNISTGGRLHLRDGNTIEITNSMVLATVEVDAKLPPTPDQKTGMMWVYGWLLVSFASAIYTLAVKLFSK